jgi:DNA modification methylase
MISEELAASLANRFIKPGIFMLDPFCGTGRTLLAAAECGANCVGIDINPLATLIARAKYCNPNIKFLKQCSEGIKELALLQNNYELFYDLQPNRVVQWFSKGISAELCTLITFLNKMAPKKDDRIILATLLSATARSVSYCRKDSWKLHRIKNDERKLFKKSAIYEFSKRLDYVVNALAEEGRFKGNINVITGDARHLSSILAKSNFCKQYDLVISSPPYGDSHTTVQYGAMSALSLGVVQHLKGFEKIADKAEQIDRNCLGGVKLQHDRNVSDQRRVAICHWHGSKDNHAERRVASFLHDLYICCSQISRFVRPGGSIVFVVSRRSVGGWRLKIDNFLIDTFAEFDINLQLSTQRRIQEKLMPSVINRVGRKMGTSFKQGRVPTMKQELILEFRKT